MASSEIENPESQPIPFECLVGIPGYPQLPPVMVRLGHTHHAEDDAGNSAGSGRMFTPADIWSINRPHDQ